MLTSSSRTLRTIPAVDTLLKSLAFGELVSEFGRPRVLACLRKLLDEQRKRLAVERGARSPDEDTLAAECRVRLDAAARPSIRPVFNLTGTVLHTNLGPRAATRRRPSPRRRRRWCGAVNLEYDIEGGRSRRTRQRMSSSGCCD